MWAKVRWVVLVGIAAAFFFILYVQLAYEVSYGRYVYLVEDVPRPELSTDVWGIFDPTTGEHLAGNNEMLPVPIASLTKLMTASAVLDTADLAATTTVSWQAVVTEGRAGRLRAGEELSMRELLFPLLLESSNDAAEVYAEALEGDLLVARMNERATALGMRDTHFIDASGLSAGNVSTVSDLVTLVSHLFQNQRYLFDITRLPKYIGEDHTWLNGNLVASERGYLGGKNGYTDEARRTLIAIFDEPLKNGEVRPVGIILLRSEDPIGDLALLHAYIQTAVSYAYVL